MICAHCALLSHVPKGHNVVMVDSTLKKNKDSMQKKLNEIKSELNQNWEKKEEFHTRTIAQEQEVDEILVYYRNTKSKLQDTNSLFETLRDQKDNLISNFDTLKENIRNKNVLSSLNEVMTQEIDPFLKSVSEANKFITDELQKNDSLQDCVRHGVKRKIASQDTSENEPSTSRPRPPDSNHALDNGYFRAGVSHQPLNLAQPSTSYGPPPNMAPMLRYVQNRFIHPSRPYPPINLEAGHYPQLYSPAVMHQEHDYVLNPPPQ